MSSRTGRPTVYTLAVSIGILSILLVNCAQLSEQSLILSDVDNFDVNDQGWHVSEVAESTIPNYSPRGGNPNGYIFAIDRLEAAWYFVASPGFTQKVQKGYGKVLRFDLMQSSVANQYDTDDVILTDGKDKLTFNTSYNPGTTWTSYTIPLDEFSGWEINHKKATKADIERVLSKLTEVRIRGEFVGGADTGGLDNASIL
ncbi:laminin B domain-containing protein [Spirosoma fluviale]|uniref:Laminin B (Domain IV) n=1 Tax=Spirosoma fluviale TaxID=1597977 RepID=A0A286GIH3_9BACT|nr:laminin B domain-containing protein [Spirosoma fluviale]SOD95335.1 Laminin B (Domain IV) [Spirosoma fluviale]